MKRIGAVALVVGAGLAFATVAPAKSSHQQLKCGTGYVRGSFRVPERDRHGRIVRHHGKIVYTRVQRCVRATKPKPPSAAFPPATLTFPPTTTTTPPSPLEPVVLSSPPPPSSTAPVNTAPPTISGNTTQGNTLSASTGTWTNAPTSYGYQWQRCQAGGVSCSATGVTTSTYALTSPDVGSTIRVSLAAANAAGSSSATSGAAGPVTPATSPGDPVVVAVGDIACPATGGPSCRQAATEALAKNQNPSAVFVLGDNQYDSGSFAEYTSSGAYNATWGFFGCALCITPSIVHPVTGNHEYGTAGAGGYFQYFGQGIANPDNTPNGYYSFNVGSWHIDALNSSCSDSGCSDPLPGTTTTAQTSWLQNDLAHSTSACTLAMWHHPLFSSGWTGGSPGVLNLWTALYSAHADVVLGGHDHLYEDYGQQDPSGNPTTTGIREFVVGTGGEGLNGLSSIGPQPQAYDDSQFGVLVLTLHASSYSWKFVTTSGTTTDSGTTACHGPGAAPAAVAAAHVARSALVARLSGPSLVFGAHPLASSLTAVEQQGLRVAIHASRGVDVVVTASLRRGRRLRRIASFYETESQIPKPFSQILFRLPARALQGMTAATLVIRFAAVDSAEHHRTVTRTVSLR